MKEWSRYHSETYTTTYSFSVPNTRSITTTIVPVLAPFPPPLHYTAVTLPRKNHPFAKFPSRPKLSIFIGATDPLRFRSQPSLTPSYDVCLYTCVRIWWRCVGAKWVCILVPLEDRVQGSIFVCPLGGGPLSRYWLCNPQSGSLLGRGLDFIGGLQVFPELLLLYAYIHVCTLQLLYSHKSITLPFYITYLSNLFNILKLHNISNINLTS